MKRRSLKKIFIFNVLTLGLYEFYWLSVTRKELTALTGYRIQSIARLLLIRLASLAVFLLALWNLHVAVQPRPVVEKPSAACLARYDADPACKQAVDRYYAGDNQLRALVFFSACVMLLAGLYWLGLRWLVSYCEAVERVTGGRSAANTVMFLVFMYSPGIGMLIVQSRFNESGARA